MSNRQKNVVPDSQITPKIDKKQLSATEAADLVLRRYRETFVELARYDRGEKPTYTISL